MFVMTLQLPSPHLSLLMPPRPNLLQNPLMDLLQNLQMDQLPIPHPIPHLTPRPNLLMFPHQNLLMDPQMDLSRQLIPSARIRMIDVSSGRSTESATMGIGMTCLKNAPSRVTSAVVEITTVDVEHGQRVDSVRSTHSGC